MKNNCICHVPYLRNSIPLWLWFLVHFCQMMISPGVCFFSLFQNVGFRVVRKIKGWKTTQNDKKFCLSHYISQEPYIIWFSFMVHMYKMIISPCVFFIFSKFLIFWIVRGVKGQQMVQNDKKILSITLNISGTIHQMIIIYSTPV